MIAERMAGPAVYVGVFVTVTVTVARLVLAWRFRRSVMRGMRHLERLGGRR